MTHGCGPATDVILWVRDADADGLPDEWERTFGLDPSVASDATVDSDGDGKTNLEEYRGGTHPRALITRYFAEGAANGFFRTHLDIVNTGALNATLVTRLVGSNGLSTARVDTLSAGGYFNRDLGASADVPTSDFSIVLESNQPLVADRTMTWDTSGFGAHAETAIASPSTQWFLAEGATHGRFNTFYLLHNPNDAEAQISIKYLRGASGPPIVKPYRLAPNARRTIWVNGEDPGLVSADVAADIVSSLPIVVERAVYRDVTDPFQRFAAGHAGAGATSAASRWFLAEGATGYFDSVLPRCQLHAARHARAHHLSPVRRRADRPGVLPRW